MTNYCFAFQLFIIPLKECQRLHVLAKPDSHDLHTTGCHKWVDMFNRKDVPQETSDTRGMIHSSDRSSSADANVDIFSILIEMPIRSSSEASYIINMYSFKGRKKGTILY